MFLSDAEPSETELSEILLSDKTRREKAPAWSNLYCFVLFCLFLSSAWSV